MAIQSVALDLDDPITTQRLTIDQRAKGLSDGLTFEMAKNVIGTDLQPCCFDPVTGYYRDGFCNTGGGDFGVHTVCCEMTDEFLEFSRAAGNDLSTPVPEYNFPGLNAGDYWCLCAQRWTQALKAGVAPRVKLEATHMSTLEFASLDDLKKHSCSGEPEV